MRRKIKILNLATCSLALLFCGILNSPVAAQKLPIALQNDTELSPSNPTAYADEAKLYKKERNVINRNKLIFMAISQIDLNFGKFQKEKRKRNALFQTLLDILEIGASTAISITNGERAKTLIAEGLGFVQNSRTSINKNLNLLEFQILFNKMIEKRAVILKAIADKATRSDTEYPFELAFVDIVAYYQAGTIDGALSNLSIDTGAAATLATKGIEEVKIVTADELELSTTYKDLRVKLFGDLKTGTAEEKAAAFKKLKTALKDNADLVNKPPAEIESLDMTKPSDVENLKTLYLLLGTKLTANPDKLAKVIESLKK